MVDAPPPPPRWQRWLLPLLIGVTPPLTTLLGIATNIATDNNEPPPAWLAPIVKHPWETVGAVTLLSTIVALLSYLMSERREAAQAAQAAAAAQDQREQLLARVESLVSLQLDNLLGHQVQVRQHIQITPDVVRPPWRSWSRMRRSSSAEPLSHASLLGVFDQYLQQLLILGHAGAGKTTRLLELARQLTERARTNPRERIPIVLTLSSWKPGQSIRRWLASALRDAIGASPAYARTLAASNMLLLLLDGLDEVPAEDRVGCIHAINTYLHEGLLSPPLVVCCRSDIYQMSGEELQLAGAIELAPLDIAAIETALGASTGTAAVLKTLQTDPLLHELVTTPLMLTVLLLAHGGQSLPEVHAQTIEQRRAALFDAYIRQMLEQRPLEPQYPAAPALRTLWWLAQGMRTLHRTEFLLDDVQPAEVLSPRGLRWYRWLVRACFLLIGLLSIGSAGAVIMCVLGWLEDGQRGAVIGAIVGVYLGICMGGIGAGMYTGFLLDLDEIVRHERLKWSWTAIWRGRGWLVYTAATNGLLIAAFGWLRSGAVAALASGLLGAALMGLIVGARLGLQPQDLARQVAPLMGIRASLRTGVAIAVLNGISLALGLGLIFALITALSRRSLIEVGGIAGVGAIMGLTIGLAMGLGGGVGSFVQHYALRAILRIGGLLPWRAVDFLDALSSRLFLERIGAVYRFRHRQLHDHIANLTAEKIKALAADDSRRSSLG
jgi:hypothetical protein